MSASTAVTIDLDGTLLLGTQDDYEDARQAAAELIASNFDDVTVKEAANAQKKHSRELLSDYGLSKERFPEACVQAAEDFGDVDESFAQELRQLGRTAFKSENEYASRGLADGARELFNTATARAEVIILTAGDEEVQSRKLDALDIPEDVDSTIVGMGEKSETLERLSDKHGRVLHIGNSASSDVQAAADANVDCIYVPDEEWRESNVPEDEITHFRAVENLVKAEQELSAYLNPPAIH